MARTATPKTGKRTSKASKASAPAATPLTPAAMLAGFGGVPASASVPQPLAPTTSKPTTPTAPRPVSPTPVAVAYATKLTAPVVAGGAPTTAKLTGTMLATLRALQAAGAPITHTALALATGRDKGNQLRPLLALGYTSTVAVPGTRGYVYSITPAGSAALAAATPATGS